MAKGVVTAVVCLLLAGTIVVRAQAPVSTNDLPPEAPPQPPACSGLLCGGTPADTGQPAGVDTPRPAAEPAVAEPSPEPSQDAPRTRKKARVTRGVQRAKGHAAVSRARKTEPSGNSADMAKARAAEASSPPAINTIFVLAPRPFEPFGGDYAPWLERLAWPSHFDRAGDRTVFTPDGYAESKIGQPAEARQTPASDDLTRRTDSLSQRGFQTLKTDLNRS